MDKLCTLTTFLTGEILREKWALKIDPYEKKSFTMQQLNEMKENYKILFLQYVFIVILWFIKASWNLIISY